MSKDRKFHVGDVFVVYDHICEKWRYVILTRALVTKEHFFLQSLTSFEPLNDRVISYENRFEHTHLDMGNIEYLANSSEIKFLGDIEQGREILVDSFERIFKSDQVLCTCP